MIGARAAVLGALVALGVAIAYQAIVRLVEGSGARDEPALVLVLLLAAFLGVLTAVVTRTLRLPGATAPTVLVIGWIGVPAVLGAIPSEATRLLAGDPALTAAEALALVAATIAAAITLSVPAERR